MNVRGAVRHAWLFRERVPPARWLSLALGFVGVVVAVRPSADGVGAGALFALLAAFGYATLMVSARGIRGPEPMLTLIVYIVLGQLFFSAWFQPWVWRPVAAAHWPGIGALALFSTAGLTLVSHAFRTAPASLIAPLEYSGLLWAALIGWLFWRELPDGGFYLGAGLIVASGMLVASAGLRRREALVPNDAAVD